MKRTMIVLALAALAFAAQAQQTLYKLIDRNGKVTYSEKPPKDFDGKVIRMDIDPNANTATLPKPGAKGEDVAPRNENERIIRRPVAEPVDRVKVARDRLEAAKQALAQARDNPREGDITWVGNAGRGTRPIPTPEYVQRLEQLEREVQQAEVALKAAEEAR